MYKAHTPKEGSVTRPMEHPMDHWARQANEVVWAAGAPRSIPLETMWSRAKAVMGLCGVTRVADIGGFDVSGVPAAAAYRPNARGWAIARGKGLTVLAARISALMEAIEYHHAEHIELPLRLARAHELPATAPLDMLPRSAHATSSDNHPLLWVEAMDLEDGRPVWVPQSLVSLDMSLPSRLGNDGFCRGSNGLASGATHLEAILHALCELIERDAAYLWSIEGDPIRTCLDPESVTDVGHQWVLERCAEAGLMVVCHDVTSDMGVPVVRAEVLDANPTPASLPPSPGYGCHPHVEVAMLRAVTEAIQTRLVHASGGRDDLRRLTSTRTVGGEEGVARQQEMAALCANQHPWPSTSQGARRAADSCPPEQWLDRLAMLLERLAEAGVKPCVVDLTHKRVGIPVVRVIAPGLEGAAAFTAVGLLDGPRALAARARAEAGAAVAGMAGS